MPSPFDTRTIEQLYTENPADPFSGDERIEIVQDGESKGAVAQQLYDWVAATAGAATTEQIVDAVAA